MFQTLSLKQLTHRLYKNVSIYGSGMLLLKGGQYLLLPYFLVVFSAQDFGVIGITQIIASVLSPFFQIGLFAAIQRMYYEWQDDERRERAFLIWFLSVFLSLCLCLCLDYANKWVFSWMVRSVAYDPYVRITLYTTFLVNLGLIPQILMQTQERLKLYSLICGLTFVTQIACMAFFIFYLKAGVLGYLYALFANAGFWAFYYVFFMLKETAINFKWATLKEPLRYTLPLLPTTVLEGLIESLDRFILEKFVGLNQVGVYTLARQFGNGFNFLNTIIKKAWLPLIYRIASERTDAPMALSYLSHLYITFMTIPALVIAIFASDFITLFSSNPFPDAGNLIALMILAFYWQTLAIAFGRGLDLVKKTNLSFIIPLAALIANLTVSTSLIPKWGVYGAVIAFNATLLIKMLSQVILSCHYMPRQIDYKNIAYLFFGSLSVYGLFSLISLNSAVYSLLIKVTLLAVILGIFFIFQLPKKIKYRLQKNLQRRGEYESSDLALGKRELS